MMIVINLHVFRCCCPFVARETQKKKKSCRGHLIAEFDTEAGVVSLFFLHGYEAPQKSREGDRLQLRTSLSCWFCPSASLAQAGSNPIYLNSLF